jgi:hypothetical protein
VSSAPVTPTPPNLASLPFILPGSAAFTAPPQQQAGQPGPIKITVQMTSASIRM